VKAFSNTTLQVNGSLANVTISYTLDSKTFLVVDRYEEPVGSTTFP
jgi:hypothetical protein